MQTRQFGWRCQNIYYICQLIFFNKKLQILITFNLILFYFIANEHYNNLQNLNVSFFKYIPDRFWTSAISFRETTVKTRRHKARAISIKRENDIDSLTSCFVAERF